MENRESQRSTATYLIFFSLSCAGLFFILALPYPQFSQGIAENIKGPKIEKSSQIRIQQAYGNLPLSFIQNDGQLNKKVRFYEKGNGRMTFFTEDGVHLSMTKGQRSTTSTNPGPALIKLKPLSANKHPKIVAQEMQPGKVNYFIGNDPKKWKTNIPTYQAVVYKEIYPGIDMKFYGNNKQMEYDIIVKPGADPSVVKFSYDGIEELRVTDEGDLEIRMEEGTILQKKPIVYQEIEGKRIKLDGKFKILEHKDAIGHGEDKAYAIEVAQYDTNHPLIIDPVLVYSTYLGGSGDDQAYGIAVDTSGNAYVTGDTYFLAEPAANFPVTPGALQTNSGDAFVAKLNASGSALVYSTYLGGSSGAQPWGIAVDGSGNAYVTGRTNSTNFPVTPGAAQMSFGGAEDGFVAKLNASGSALIYSTYLGGSNQDEVHRIAVDGSGNAYVTGDTNSTDFPVTPGAIQTSFGGNWDVFVAKLSASGSALDFSTYLGGSSYDYGYGIAVDGSGNAYVTGDTNSTNFPVTPGAIQTSFGGGGDVFVAKLNASGNALVYSTYLGGSGGEGGSGIALDRSGNAYVTGSTNSTNFPVTLGAAQASYGGGGGDVFVAKLNASGNALVYSTYLGGSSGEGGSGIALDISGNAYVTGDTTSPNFPVTPCAIQTSFGGGSCFGGQICPDAFVAKLNASGSALDYSTYLGGSRDDAGFDIAVDTSGNAYVTGYTGSTDFPTANPLQAANASDRSHNLNDAFVTKIGEPPTTTTTTSTSTTTSTVTTTTTTILTTTSTSTTTTTLKKCKDQGKGKDKNKCKDKFKDKEKINMKEKDTSLPFSKN